MTHPATKQQAQQQRACDARGLWSSAPGQGLPGSQVSPVNARLICEAKMTYVENAYDRWMAKVDAWLIRHCGLPSADLDDWGYYGAFEDGVTPSQAARAALRYARGYDD